jgi:hypothetical protein
MASMNEPQVSSAREQQVLAYLKAKGHNLNSGDMKLTPYERKALEILILPHEIDTGFSGKPIDHH